MTRAFGQHRSTADVPRACRADLHRFSQSRRLSRAVRAGFGAILLAGPWAARRLGRVRCMPSGRSTASTASTSTSRRGSTCCSTARRFTACRPSIRRAQSEAADLLPPHRAARPDRRSPSVGMTRPGRGRRPGRRLAAALSARRAALDVLRTRPGGGAAGRDERDFTFLRACGSRCNVVLGDARLSLQRPSAAGTRSFVLDAFSSDAIPVHLLTNEAFGLYLSHLTEDGALAVHISNRHLTLSPSWRAWPANMGSWPRTAGDGSEANPSTARRSSHWVAMARRTRILARCSRSAMEDAGVPAARPCGRTTSRAS